MSKTVNQSPVRSLDPLTLLSIPNDDNHNLKAFNPLTNLNFPDENRGLQKPL